MFAKIRFLLAGLLAFSLFSGMALADSKPSMDDAKAMTLKAADLIAAKGLEAAVAVFNAEGKYTNAESLNFDREAGLYVNVIDLNGVWKAYPPRPAGVGQSVINVKDPDGKMLVQEIIKVAKEAGEGWVEYRWLNPASNKIEPKVTFVKRVPGQELVAYVGIYK